MIILVAFLCAQNPADARVSFCAVGDVLLDRGIRRAINEHTIDYPFALVKAFIQEHDLAFCNLECPVSAKGRSTGKIYCFRADTSFFHGAGDAGFDIFSLANNHIIDWGQEACLDTRSFIDAQNLYSIGAGKDQKDAQKPLILTQHGLRFALFAYLGDPLKGVVWSEKRPGPAQAGIDEVCKAIRAVRDRVDFIIVSIHWGTEYVHIPSKNQVSWAHAMVDAGADLIVGHHPHVLQSIEMYRDRVILYSLGNFLFDQHKTYQKQTGIFSCVFKPGRIDSASFTPCFISEYRPSIAEDTIYTAIREKITAISKTFNTRFIDDSTAVLIADSSGSIARAAALGRESTGAGRIMVYAQRVELLDTLSSLKDILLIPDRDTIRDYCVIADTFSIHLCALVSSPARRYIMHCCAGDSGFEHTWCNEEIRDPWKVLAADLDGDGRDEFGVVVRTTEPHQESATNKLLVYSVGHDCFEPLYRGSRKSTDFIDCAFLDREQDGLAELFTFESGPEQTVTLNVYQWLGTGFWKYPDVPDTVATTWIEDALHDTYGISDDLDATSLDAKRYPRQIPNSKF